MEQAENTLLLRLRQLYGRLSRMDPERREGYRQLYDVYTTAGDLSLVASQINALREQAAESDPSCSSRQVYEEALTTLNEALACPDLVRALVVGYTDGFRHLCLDCGQEETNFASVRFFQNACRRPLLKPEVSGRYRSAYSRCQLCWQPIVPSQLVLLFPAGTGRHMRGCPCGSCTRAGLVTILNIYACELQTQELVLPRLEVVHAPSYAQCQDLAQQRCWEQGWYILNASYASVKEGAA